MHVGQKIKRLRELRNYTQEYIATQIGITQESYSKIEANKTNLSTQRLEQIASILEVNTADLINFDDKIIFNTYNNTLTSHEHSNQNANQGIITIQSEREKDLYERIIEQQKQEIASLKSEIDFLRSMGSQGK